MLLLMNSWKRSSLHLRKNAKTNRSLWVWFVFKFRYNVKWAKPGGGTEAVDHVLYLHAPLSSFFLLQNMTGTSSYFIVPFWKVYWGFFKINYSLVYIDFDPFLVLLVYQFLSTPWGFEHKALAFILHKIGLCVSWKQTGENFHASKPCFSSFQFVTNTK